MHPLTETDLRASFVNASRREVAQATLPDLEPLDWERLDYLGWTDAKRPQMSYVVLPTGEGPVGIVLRTAARSAVRRKAMCAWCQDLAATEDAHMYVARRAGALGRRGNTVGTLICADFRCSRNVRRTPSIEEVGSDDPVDRAALIERRIQGLQERSARFAANVCSESDEDEPE
ncbi:FBP domain-containing protein [Allobranchiibius huperziae]|uniref:Elongation factor G-binding protein C-terminal treble-clef zinc-finger domain-containing protein n=1 Tax=Allobranchiibius huperziae TaxID=1874116 RepID=A0A853DHL5_9MICO|nr:FBP domain-containing protein [Allobranchiibius huperziae]NYJ76258.1 hypothetical protein [Allobranchiibius huperziae]